MISKSVENPCGNFVLPFAPFYQEVQAIDERTIREEYGLFYITEIKVKTYRKTIPLENVNGMACAPGEIEGTLQKTIVDKGDTFDIIETSEVRAAPPFFLEIAGQVRASRDQLKVNVDKLEEVKKDLEDTEAELQKFRPFIDRASLLKKKAHFREQRQRK